MEEGIWRNGESRSPPFGLRGPEVGCFLSLGGCGGRVKGLSEWLCGTCDCVCNGVESSLLDMRCLKGWLPFLSFYFLLFCFSAFLPFCFEDLYPLAESR